MYYEALSRRRTPSSSPSREAFSFPTAIRHHVEEAFHTLVWKVLTNHCISQSYQLGDGALKTTRFLVWLESFRIQISSDPPGGESCAQLGNGVRPAGRSGLLGAGGQNHGGGQTVHTQSRDVDLITAVGGKLGRETKVQSKNSWFYCSIESNEPLNRKYSYCTSGICTV